MWADEVFFPAFTSGHAELGRPDLGMVASYGFQATADLPMALYFEQIHEQFPHCKFILTTRETSEKWFKSWDTLAKSITQPTRYGGLFIRHVQTFSNYLRWLFAIVNQDDNYLVTPFPLPDQNKQAAIASYEAHNARVRKVIPPHLLLEYNVEQGWEPLCTFLEIAHCPETPFPKSNSAVSVQAQSIAALCVPLCMVLFVLIFSVTIIFQHVTGMTVLQWINHKAAELMHRIKCPSRVKRA